MYLGDSTLHEEYDDDKIYGARIQILWLMTWCNFSQNFITGGQ